MRGRGRLERLRSGKTVSRDVEIALPSGGVLRLDAELQPIANYLGELDPEVRELAGTAAQSASQVSSLVEDTRSQMGRG